MMLMLGLLLMKTISLVLMMLMMGLLLMKHYLLGTYDADAGVVTDENIISLVLMMLMLGLLQMKTLSRWY